MSTEATELSVSQARDKFSDAVNRAAFGGEITYVTRAGGKSAAAIVPAELAPTAWGWLCGTKRWVVGGLLPE